jgi:hypothetical protein
MKGATLLVVVAAALFFSGCSKGDKEPQSLQMNGVSVDLPRFNEAFANAPDATKRVATEVGFNLRYNKYEQALMALDKLSTDPNVTEPQKKVTADLIEQVKKLANAPAPGAPAQ